MCFSDLVVPILLAVILAVSMIRRNETFSHFTSGAEDGLRTAFRILPSLVGLMTCIGMLRASGALDIFCAVIAPLTEKIGLPPEILPLALIRPLSGSGSLSLCQQIMAEHGPDSTVGRIAGVLQGSGETTFYIISLYYSSIAVSRTRHAIPSSLIGDVAGVLASCWLVPIIFS